MLNLFLKKLKLAFTDARLLKKIGFVIFALVLFRVLAAIPIPGVDTVRLAEFFSSNQFLGFLNIFSGGGLSSLSIVMLGVAPYITASIIMQVLTIVFPKLKAMYREEGEAGRKKFAQYGRLLSIPLAFIQGFSFLFLLQSQGVVEQLSGLAFASNLIVIVAGSVLLMWVGELVTEFGIGNGVSIIIFAGIVAGLPQTISQLSFSFDPSQAPLFLLLGLVALLVIYGIVLVTEAERPIPVTYARAARGGRNQQSVSTYVPLRLNQAGVIPIIFALSILVLPQLVLNFVSQQTSIPVLAEVAQTLLTLPGGFFMYGAFYFVLVFLFTFFYTAVTFDPNEMADNLQKSGAFIPGVRPGTQTSEYIGRVITRITLVGAIFLGVVAVLPLVIQSLTGFTALAIGGTALLIVVSVVLDIVRKVDAQVSLREY